MRGQSEAIDGFESCSDARSALSSLALAAGCSSLRDRQYERPDVPDKPQWSQLEGRELTASEVIQPDWWTGFGDP